MTPTTHSLSLVLIALMRGLVHAEKNPQIWQTLSQEQNAVRDYVALLGLELVVNEEEGFAWLRNRQEGETDLPTLVVRRPLSYPVSLLLVLLRRKLAEHDGRSSDPRLILSRDQIVEMVRVFLPERNNEAKLVDQIGSYINKIIDFGFARHLKGDEEQIEILRVLKAFVDAQWLADFDTRLATYRAALEIQK
ncbi:MAG TPA: DUF4194 domain-containing protein [Fibrobacteraceae bacterium]|nr:DUF4194 domain-containing protein [Fibrobacteraceae bacterium]